MQPFRAFLIFVLVIGGLAIPAPRVAGLDPEPATAPDMPRVVRVLDLRGVDVHEVMKLLRQELKLRSLAPVPERNLIVVSDVGEKVDEAEKLLRERGVLVEAISPHGPLDYDRLQREPEATRRYWLDDDDLRSTLTVLRAIYSIKELTESAEDDSILVREDETTLDAIGAILEEFGVLIDSADVPD